ncbi:MAG: SusC/RagA family TonB-linked outer membrane protein, partial [Muribaculaceae bacterium]|nr:SusC/RagA family TonB-linked outer membrane protein [Muribaculaceae bacterium]
MTSGQAWGFTANAQNNKVTGVVRDGNGEPLIGATVQVKGTNRVTATDIDGKYSIQAAPGSTLVIKYVGSPDKEVNVTGGVVDIDMSDANALLDEVVVTALGIKKERKALGYNVTDLKSEEILKNKNTNVINSLAGKVPGVNVTQSSGAAGAGASIIIRGANSTSEGRDNTPLFVVDGVIYDNSTTVLGNSGQDGVTRNATTFSNRVMDINPEDIESLSVLKGAAAAALYGSRAADGAIIITTKKGAEGSVRVEYSGKISTSWANKLPEVQKTFGRGVYSTNGVLSDQTYSSWGEPFAPGATIYDNIGNFFQHGTILDNNVSISGGSKNTRFYLSLSNYDQKGIVPKTKYDKTTVRFNGEQKFDRLTVGANVTYSIAKTNKTLTSGGLWEGTLSPVGTGSMNALYSWPLDQDVSHYLNEDGTKYRLFEGVWDLASDKENPYWIINKNDLYDKTHRFTGALNAVFEIADWWNVSGRLGYDNYTTDAYTFIAPGSVAREMMQNGRLSKADYRYEYISTNIMTDFHKAFGDWDLGLMLGTSTDNTKRNNQNHWGYDFITAGTVSFSNISAAKQFFKDSNSRKRMVSIFGEARASWRNTVFLTVTGRNDWSSTLPINERSYFYPSVSGAFVFTELMQPNDILTFGKIRGSWAQVGKDANVFATLTYLENPMVYASFQGVGNQYYQGNMFLKPEIQTAWEIGAEFRFFNNRLGLDWTYYHSSTKNQIASPRLSNANGYIFASINSGSVINKGMEIAVTARPVQTRDFDWDLTLNLSYNRGTLGEFLSGVGMF